jgi:5-methylcytosine-specific restriction protein A
MPRRPPSHRPSNAGDPRVDLQQRRTASDRHRPSPAQRGYDGAWRRLRTAHLQANPLCAHCLKMGIIRVAEVVDHIIPISERPDLRLDPDNLQSLDAQCHNAKTAREDGGFGRAKQPRD